MSKKAGWFTSHSVIRYEFPKPKGFEDWFYTGATRHFGHEKSQHKRH